jgi:hypothetical protein
MIPDEWSWMPLQLKVSGIDDPFPAPYLDVEAKPFATKL